MAKSARSKTKKRFRTLKRQHLTIEQDAQDYVDLHNNLQSTINGVEYRKPDQPNMFKYPNKQNAIIPQYVPGKLIDFRMGSSQLANNNIIGGQHTGAFRKEGKRGKYAERAILASEIVEREQNNMNTLEEVEEVEEVEENEENSENDFVEEFQKVNLGKKQKQKDVMKIEKPKISKKSQNKKKKQKKSNKFMTF